MNHLRNASADQWQWVKEDPSGLKYFCNDIDLLVCTIECLKKLANFDVVDIFTSLQKHLPKRDTVLHLLAKDQVNETKMGVIMDLLQKGFRPGLKNKAGQRFLDVSNFKDTLLEQIQIAPDSWVINLFKSWIIEGE